MNITVDKTVSYAVKTVVVDMVHLHNSGDVMRISAPYKWVDADGKVLRQGTHNATEADINALGAEAAASVPLIKGLIPAGKGGSAIIRLNANGTLKNVFQNGRDNGGLGDTYVRATLTPEQVAVVISPMTVEQLVGMVGAMTSVILE